MDNPGHSIFAGGSLHLDGITANNEEEDLQREQEEEEEIQDLLVNAFDDLEEDESCTHHSGHPYTVPSSGGDGGNGLDRTLTDSYPPQNHHQDVQHNGYQEYRSDLYDHHNAYHLEGQVGGFPDGQRSPENASHRSSSSSVAPWSEDSRGTSPTMFNPIQSYETAGDGLGDATAAGDLYEKNCGSVGDQVHGVLIMEPYNGDSIHPYHKDKQDNQDMLDLNNQYKEAETTYSQLKLLYEARGRELDRQMSDYAKLKFESNHDIRALQHQFNLSRSENEEKSASVQQLQILLSVKEERTKTLVADMKELKNKFLATQDENNKFRLELETAESTISSLECQELTAVDSLSKNQKLQEEFIRKLQQGNKEDKDMLLSKLQESQKDAQASQQEVKRLREELKNMRNMYDGADVQKTETVAKLNVTIETMRKQYEQLLQAHDSQEILKLKVKSLEASNQNLEERSSMLEIELKKAKEDLKSFDMAIKLGVMKDVIPEEESMMGLGIKKVLTYNDTTVKDTRNDSTQRRLPDGSENLQIREELKKSLMINKAKRDEIAMLREDVQEKQARIRKAASDLRDAHTQIKQLREQVLRLQMEKDEKGIREGDDKREMQGGGGNTGPSINKGEAIQLENSSLRQEVAHLMAYVRNGVQLYNTLSYKLSELKNGQKDSLSQEQFLAISSKVDELLSHTDTRRKLSTEVECLHEMLTEMRKENAALHHSQALWEKRLGNLEVKLKVLEKMIMKLVTDPDKDSEMTLSLTTLQRLLSDLGELVTVVKSEIQESSQEKLRLCDKLSACQLDIEKANDRIHRLEEEKGNLEARAADIENNKNMVKDAELESYQKTYLKFHEEAMHELEANVKVEYERIATDLKEKILQLNKELEEVKECYIQVCQEKNQLEERLEHHLESRSMSQESRRIQQGTRTTLSTPDSGISGEPVTQGVQQAQEVMLHKEIETLKEELVFVKKQSTKLEQQTPQLAIVSKQHPGEDDAVIMGQANHVVREVQETCNKLEKVNQELRLKETLSEEAVSEEIGTWKAILERQQKRMNDEKEELRIYYDNVIEELQIKYMQVESSKLLEDKVKEQESNMKTLSNKIKELESVIATTSSELRKAKCSLQAKEEEREKEVEKLTDMLLNKEDKLREKEELCEVIRLRLQNYAKKFDSELSDLKEKMQRAEAEIKEKERKYIHLKLKFEKYNEVRNQNKYYKDELNRLWDDFAAKKAAIIERVRGCLEEVKEMFMKQIEVIKESLGGMGKSQQITEVVKELDQLASNVKNFKLLIT